MASLHQGPFIRYVTPFSFPTKDNEATEISDDVNTADKIKDIARNLKEAIRRLFDIFEHPSFAPFQSKYRILLYQNPDDHSEFIMYLEFDSVAWYDMLKSQDRNALANAQK